MPEDLVSGPDGNLWFTDEGSSPAIGRITPSGAISEFSQGTPPGFFPFAIAEGPNNDLWYTDSGTTPGVGVITPTGAISEFSTGVGSSPTHLVYGPNASMWFTDPGKHELGSITAAGSITAYSSGLNPGSIPGQLAVGSDGNVWFTDTGTTPAIGRINEAGQITEFTNGIVGQPGQIVLGPNNNLWFTENSPVAIGEITPSGEITTYSSGLLAGSEPYSIIAGPDNTLWFTDRGAQPAVGRISASGQITEFAGLPTSSVPSVMAFGSDGNLWFTDEGTRSVGKITPSGQISEYAVGDSSVVSPYVIVPAPDGNLWFTDSGDGDIGRVLLAGGTGSSSGGGKTGSSSRGVNRSGSSVSPIPTTTVDSIRGGEHRFGSRATYVAKTSSPGREPTGGRVTFRVGSTVLCTATLKSGTAKCESRRAPKAGKLTLLARYGGTSVFRASTGRSLARVLPSLVHVSVHDSVARSASSAHYYVSVVARSPGRGTPSGKVAIRSGHVVICIAHLRHRRGSCVGDVVSLPYSASYRPSNSNFKATTIFVAR